MQNDLTQITYVTSAVSLSGPSGWDLHIAKPDLKPPHPKGEGMKTLKAISFSVGEQQSTGIACTCKVTPKMDGFGAFWIFNPCYQPQAFPQYRGGERVHVIAGSLEIFIWSLQI